MLSWRALGTDSLSIVAQPVGGGLDSDELHQRITDTLAEFGLTGTPVTR